MEESVRSVLRSFTLALSSEKRDGDSLYGDSNAPPLKRARIIEPDISTDLSSSSYAIVPMVPTPRNVTLSNSTINKLPHQVNQDPNTILQKYETSEPSDGITTSTFLKNLLCRFRLGVSVEKEESIVKYEMSVLKKTEVVVETKAELSMELCREILALSDDTFDVLLSRQAHAMGPDNLNRLTTYACTNNSKTQLELLISNKRKFVSIAMHGLLPKFAQNELARKLYVSYEKLLGVDEELVMDHLLLPLLCTKHCLVKILYTKVNLHILLLKLLNTLVGGSIRLNPTLISTLAYLLERETEYLSSPASDHLFVLLKTSTTGCAMDEKVAGFYFWILQKFLRSMTEREVEEMESLNLNNSTIYSESIQELFQKRRAYQQHFSFDNQTSDPEQHMEVEDL